jgi:aspartyl-tRNA(Asn)/glutamyl-tRNA(Gln) amidotransferase subunit A
MATLWQAKYKNLRIGVPKEYFGEGMNLEIKEKIQKAIDIFKSIGAEIKEISLPSTDYALAVYYIIAPSEASANLARYDGVKYGYRTPDKVEDLDEMYRKSRNEGFGLQPKLRILMGMYVSAAQYSQQYYNRALKVRAMIRRDFDQIFDPHGQYRLDALITPTTPTSAFEIGAVYGDSVLMQYADQLTVPANHAGTPAISIPAGLDSQRLPIGIQLLGADFSEAKLLRVAHAYELATENESWRKERPRVFG